ncbi:hypothetical protein D3C78_1517550 [compost metagenome]
MSPVMAGSAPSATSAAGPLCSSAKPTAVGRPMASAARSATQRLTGDGSMCARFISQRMLAPRAILERNTAGFMAVGCWGGVRP